MNLGGWGVGGDKRQGQVPRNTAGALVGPDQRSSHSMSLSLGLQMQSKHAHLVASNSIQVHTLP